MARDMWPNCVVPAMSAGGAVDEPFPSTWILTLGYIFANASPHSVMRLFMVSGPVLERLPETPDAFWYDGTPASTFTVCAEAETAVASRPITATNERFISDLIARTGIASGVGARSCR